MIWVAHLEANEQRPQCPFAPPESAEPRMRSTKERWWLLPSSPP